MAYAIVTGASSGIGDAIVTQLLDQGWHVTGMSRSVIHRESDRFTCVQVDMSDASALLSAIAALPPPDALIHAAGIMVAAPIGELDVSESAKLWSLHVHAAEILVNHFAPNMSAGGRIVLIGSRTSRGAAKRSQYVATKAAMVGMARSWASELAPRGITVNVVAPGATATPMLTQPGRETSKPVIPPIGRLIQPDEVAALSLYLLSPLAAAITGQEMVICGGASLS